MRRIVLSVVAALFVVPAWPSEPGEALDCDDVEFLEPGYTCEQLGVNAGLARPYNSGAFDNEGRILRWLAQQGIGDCSDTYSLPVYRWRLNRYDPATDSWPTILQITERCVEPGRIDALIGAVQYEDILFDRTNGAIQISTLASCIVDETSGSHQTAGGGNCPYVQERLNLRISGFTTMFEMLQTYTPPSGPVSFRVPYMPEGFQYADWFDTYYGTLATVGDWSQLQPLQCGYPASAPSVGDYLTVTDTLPTPTAGNGYYYVTAVTYQGQTRCGRQSSGGVLSGRDPAVLPGCAE